MEVSVDAILPYSRRATRPESFFEHQISITGASGAGTSTTVKTLLNKLDDPRFKAVSAGDIMRRIAKERGMTIEALARFNREHPEEGYQNDRRCDAMTAEEALSDFRILEGRMAHVFAPKAFHVLITCPPSVRALRRYGNDIYVSVEEGLQRILNRDSEDNKRYEQFYPGCLWQQSEFDLVIDTSESDPSEVAKKILDRHERWWVAHKITHFLEGT